METVGRLLINDINLQPNGPAGPPECSGTVGDTSFKSAFPDEPFALNGILPPPRSAARRRAPTHRWPASHRSPPTTV